MNKNLFSVLEGGEIVEEMNYPNFRLLADIYHMLMDTYKS